MTNRLVDATSPYLQQHATNPVWWWEWGDEAFLVAKEKDLPIFLSVGYSACHWCHVMAHESFENVEIAEFLNQNFVNIKVDREEHPEVDSIYMQATVAMTGHGGWPMSVFLDHERQPFYAGTYFPAVSREGHLSFPQLLTAILDTWKTRRVELNEAASRISNYLVESNLPASVDDIFNEQTAENAALKLARQFDPINHGFGASPKFPPAMALEFLLRNFARVNNKDVLELVEFTCYSMTRGGMYDQLLGGFARYSVDESWTIPHFEKMLYDNALLIGVYSHLYRVKPNDYFKRIVSETIYWLEQEMITPEGAFAAAMDADSEGEEGTYYCWSQAQIHEILNDADANWAFEQFNITTGGTFERGLSVLQRRREPDDLTRYQRVKAQLLAVREKRIKPMRDEKIIVSWNSWMISNLFEAAQIFDQKDWRLLAQNALDFLLANHLKEENLYRISKDGKTNQIPGLLEDWASLSTACFKAHAATGEIKYLKQGRFLIEQILQRFEKDGNLFDTENSETVFVTRPRETTDNAYPASIALAAEALLNAGALFNNSDWREMARRLIAEQLPKIQSAPRFAAHFLCQLEAFLDGPLEIALVGKVESEAHKLIWQSPRAGWVLSVGESGATELLENRSQIDQNETVYICQSFVCQTPISDLTLLKKALKI